MEVGTDINQRDVRPMLRTIRQEVLKDCKLVFSHVFPKNFPAALHPLWKMAEQLGATCCTDVDSSVTHVVALDRRTDKARWAVKKNKFLVNTSWIEAANYLTAKTARKRICSPLQMLGDLKSPVTCLLPCSPTQLQISIS